MTNAQIITTPAGEELVVLSRADYEALLRAAEAADEDAADVAIYDARKALGEEPLPAEISMAILRGDSRIRALRKWRGMTQQQLAAAAGITQGFLSDVEARRREASEATAGKLAAALDVPVAWLAA